MYPVPEPCTQNVVPILAADLVEIAADLAAKSAAISTRSAARIGTTFWVHGSGTGYMGSVHGTWVRYIVHGARCVHLLQWHTVLQHIGTS